MMKRIINKIWNIVITIALIAMVVAVGLIFVPKFFGNEPLIVLSGSMEPTYPVGSVLYVSHIDKAEVKDGTPITFYLDDETLVTHRVVRINDDGTYVTKGDNNDIEDAGSVSFDRILGTPKFHIVKLGILADKLSSTSGKIVYGTILVVIVILMFIGDIIFSEEKKKEEEVLDEKNHE